MLETLHNIAVSLSVSLRSQGVNQDAKFWEKVSEMVADPQKVQLEVHKVLRDLQDRHCALLRTLHDAREAAASSAEANPDEEGGPSESVPVNSFSHGPGQIFLIRPPPLFFSLPHPVPPRASRFFEDSSVG